MFSRSRPWYGWHMAWWNRLIERRILKAEAEGQLADLPGEGEPLPDRTGDVHVDPGLAAGYRVMVEAGVVPEEFRLKKKIDALITALAQERDEGTRKDLMRQIADLETKRGIAVDARRKFHQQ